MPAAEETGDFIAPEAVNRHHINVTKAEYFSTFETLTVNLHEFWVQT